MSEALPDLWALDDDARRLYEIYLATLDGAGCFRRVAEVASEIRDQLPTDGQAAFFTYGFEIQAWWKLNAPRRGWRCLREWEQRIYGRRVPLRALARQAGTGDYADAAATFYAPLLYAFGRYELGADVLNHTLLFHMNGAVSSYELLFQLYNDDPEPATPVRVTLKHFYDRLGRTLDTWPAWSRFVEGLHPELFNVTEVDRDALRRCSDTLPEFYRRLMRVQRERAFSGATRGAADLVNAADEVAAWQRETRQQKDRALERNDGRAREIRAKLRRWFPEIKHLG